MFCLFGLDDRDVGMISVGESDSIYHEYRMFKKLLLSDYYSISRLTG